MKVLKSSRISPEPILIRKKEHWDKIIQKQLGTPPSNLNCLLVNDKIDTDKNNIAKALVQHWGNVFSAKGINRTELRRWLKKYPIAISSVANADWQLTINHIDLAMKHASPSATGPDGIPYSAYQGCALASQILCEVALELLKGTTRPRSCTSIGRFSSAYQRNR